MFPYYSYGFDPYNRNSMLMPSAQAPIAPTAPIAPIMPNIPPMPIMMPMYPQENYPALPEMDFMNETNPMYDFDNINKTEETEFSNSPQRQPQPVLSNNPPIINISLFKELTGYPNYGNPSNNADILYTGTQGTWTFNVPAALLLSGTQTAQVLVRAVLDDHLNVPVNRYSARITVNGVNVHNGPVPLEHGVPVGSRFTNWRTLTFNIGNLRRANNRITIINTSTAGPGDWIGFDWMELRVSLRR
jgi:hypothetical protein